MASRLAHHVIASPTHLPSYSQTTGNRRTSRTLLGSLSALVWGLAYWMFTMDAGQSALVFCAPQFGTSLVPHPCVLGQWGIGGGETREGEEPGLLQGAWSATRSVRAVHLGLQTYTHS